MLLMRAPFLVVVFGSALVAALQGPRRFRPARALVREDRQPTLTALQAAATALYGVLPVP